RPPIEPPQTKPKTSVCRLQSGRRPEAQTLAVHQDATRYAPSVTCRDRLAPKLVAGSELAAPSWTSGPSWRATALGSRDGCPSHVVERRRRNTKVPSDLRSRGW